MKDLDIGRQITRNQIFNATRMLLSNQWLVCLLKLLIRFFFCKAFCLQPLHPHQNQNHIPIRHTGRQYITLRIMGKLHITPYKPHYLSPTRTYCSHSRAGSRKTFGQKLLTKCPQICSFGTANCNVRSGHGSLQAVCLCSVECYSTERTLLFCGVHFLCIVRH